MCGRIRKPGIQVTGWLLYSSNSRQLSVGIVAGKVLNSKFIRSVINLAMWKSSERINGKAFFWKIAYFFHTHICVMLWYSRCCIASNHWDRAIWLSLHESSSGCLQSPLLGATECWAMAALFAASRLTGQQVHHYRMAFVVCQHVEWLLPSYLTVNHGRRHYCACTLGQTYKTKIARTSWPKSYII